MWIWLWLLKCHLFYFSLVYCYFYTLCGDSVFAPFFSCKVPYNLCSHSIVLFQLELIIYVLFACFLSQVSINTWEHHYFVLRLSQIQCSVSDTWSRLCRCLRSHIGYHSFLDPLFKKHCFVLKQTQKNLTKACSFQLALDFSVP